MARFDVLNSTQLPVHIVISNGGIIEFYRNDLQPGESWGCDVGGAAWHDLTVIASNGTNQVDPSRDNVSAIAEWAVGAGAVIVGVAGLVLIPVTGGLSAPISFAAASSLAAAVTGLSISVADVAIGVADHFLHPVTVGRLYAPDGYNCEVRGGQILLEQTGPDQYQMTDVRPMGLYWRNKVTGADGMETA